MLEVGQLLLSQTALITTDTFAQGASGGITIDANDVLIFGDPDLDLSTTLASGTFDVGQSGDIDITAGRLFAQGKSILGVDVVEPTATGNGGDLSLNIRELVLQGGAQISTATFGKGNSGDLVVFATDLVELTGSNAFS